MGLPDGEQGPGPVPDSPGAGWFRFCFDDDRREWSPEGPGIARLDLGRPVGRR